MSLRGTKQSPRVLIDKNSYEIASFLAMTYMGKKIIYQTKEAPSGCLF